MNNWIYGAEIIKKYANGLGRGRDTPSDRKDNQMCGFHTTAICQNFRDNKYIQTSLNIG
jgi:hypothetical protein